VVKYKNLFNKDSLVITSDESEFLKRIKDLENYQKNYPNPYEKITPKNK
jgi:hypothetical protein